MAHTLATSEYVELQKTTTCILKNPLTRILLGVLLALKNAHATAQGTDGQMANIGGAVLQNWAKSRKANTGKETVFMSAEVDELKVPIRSSKRKRKHK